MHEFHHSVHDALAQTLALVVRVNGNVDYFEITATITYNSPHGDKLFAIADTGGKQAIG